MIRFLRSTQAFCLGGVLAITGGIACGLVAAVAFSLYYELRREAVEVQTPGFYEQVQVLPDGTPVIERQEWYSGARTFLDRDRDALAADPQGPFLEPARLWTREEAQRRFLFDRWPNAGIMHVATVRNRENWYFISGDASAGRGYFVGYDVPGRRIVGYIGANGLKQTSIPAEHQFRIDPSGLNDGNRLIRSGITLTRNEDSVFLLSGSELTFIDLGERKVRVLATDVESMDTGATVDIVTPGPQPVSSERMFVAARTRTHVAAWDPQGRLLGRVTIPADFVSGRNLWVYLTASGDALLSASSEQPGTHGEHREHAVAFMRAGLAGEQATFKVVLHQPIPRSGEVVSEEMELNVITAGVPAPLTAAGFALGLNPWAQSTDGEHSFGDALSNSIASTWPALVFILLLAAGLAWLVHRRQQAHRLPPSFGWLAFVFVLGVPGWLGYRLHRRWPVREPGEPPSPSGIEVVD